MNNINKENLLDISAVVCTYNSEKSIKDVIESLIENNVSEIIIVDADSEDNTKNIINSFIEKYPDFIKLVKDPRKGLAMARNIGIKNARFKYVINVGSDNIMPPGSIKIMLDEMLKNNWIGVSSMTLMYKPNNYFSKAMNEYKKVRYYPGERHVIGTPTLFPTKVLIDNPYDNNVKYSDDGDLCTRLSNLGYKFGIANVFVYEYGTEDLFSILNRWKIYGESDYETYKKYSPTWNLFRKIQSFLYPLNNELIKPFIKLDIKNKFYVLPFLLFITIIRYYFWIYYSIKYSFKRFKND